MLVAANVRNMIVARLAAVEVDITDVELNGLLVDHELSGDDEYVKAVEIPVKKLLLTQLSTILARPDVTQGDYTRKWDRNAVKTYVAQLQTELGMTPPKTTPTGTVTSVSDSW